MQDDTSQLIDFFQITSQDKANLSNLKQKIDPHLTKASTTLYQHITKHPMSASLLNDRTIEERASYQSQYWQEMVNGRIDEGFFRRAQQIGKIHNDNNIDMENYIGAYAHMISNIVSDLMTKERMRPQQMADHVSSLIKVSLLDLSQALTSYVDSQNADDMRDNALQNLRVIVNIASETNEAMITIAELSNDLNHLREQSQEIASAVEELVASVGEIARNTEGASNDAHVVEDTATAGVSAANSAVSTMTEISTTVATAGSEVGELQQAFYSINDIVKAIDDIASQTNLLALNATIESARAGEAGKGFAVVASEVKNLANQTARETENIRAQVQTLGSDIDRIVDSMQVGGRAVDEGQSIINETGQEINAIGEQIRALTGKMAEVSTI
ncbi:hypothetical protein MTBPR1_110007 [Candidatus Terasakiella magnetica]|uniref:Methyl-accepting transducer domain-containing protein n=1 Tax=Candidatus Terasakiella magnetica TaxID=1867952 RepID=A0A1C3REB2_9PROT|nr:globin-coupled sensor protein [Candidatus Terasakiella magnetica]SCA55568.1 hypothetical protein MTBPR1_110007 [Candidatus Terasakiella magnetica]